MIYNIEYAHIYTNESPEKEQSLCLYEVSKLKKELWENNLIFAIMVDDYSFPDPKFDYNIFIKNLKNEWFEPNIYIRESQLIESCDEVLGIINNEKLKKDIYEYIVKNKKYPCSLFIATRYMIRLWIIKSQIYNNKYIWDMLINILPKSFEEFENKWFEIIKNTEYKYILENIKNIYIKWREI